MNCLHCGVVNKSPTVSCDGCQGPLHVSCVGLSENGFKITRAKSRSIKVVCNQCNANMSQFKDIKPLISALQFQFTSAIDSSAFKLLSKRLFKKWWNVREDLIIS